MDNYVKIKYTNQDGEVFFSEWSTIGEISTNCIYQVIDGEEKLVSVTTVENTFTVSDDGKFVWDKPTKEKNGK